MTDAHDITARAIHPGFSEELSDGLDPCSVRVLASLFAVAGAPEGEARIVLYRDANGVCTVEGVARLAELPRVDGVFQPRYRVVPAGEATDE